MPQYRNEAVGNGGSNGNDAYPSWVILDFLFAHTLIMCNIINVMWKNMFSISDWFNICLQFDRGHRCIGTTICIRQNWLVTWFHSDNCFGIHQLCHGHICD